MNRPHLDLPSAPRSRGRSGSLVLKEVGNKSQEEVLDRSAYVNINANWVNVKGHSSRTLAPPS